MRFTSGFSNASAVIAASKPSGMLKRRSAPTMAMVIPFPVKDSLDQRDTDKHDNNARPCSHNGAAIIQPFHSTITPFLILRYKIPTTSRRTLSASP